MRKSVAPRILWGLLFWVLVFPAVQAVAQPRPSPRPASAPDDRSPAALINQLRGVHVGSGPENNDENRRLDAAWKKLTARKSEILPILRQELAQETKKPVPDWFFLLDAAHFVQLNDVGHRDLIVSALEKIDPDQPVIKANFEELFNMTFALEDGGEPDPRLLVLIDRLFLLSDCQVFVPAHSLTLKGSLLGAFLYGPFGQRGEEHLLTLIERSSKHTKRIVGMLNWIGSPLSLDAIQKVLDHRPDATLFKMAIGALMRVGGARGREMALKIDPKELDEESRKYYREQRTAMKAVSFEGVLRLYKKAAAGAATPRSAEDLEKQFTAAYEAGRSNALDPLAILMSSLPKETLAAKLIRVRGQMFRRLSDEAIDDVEGINEIIEAVLLRPR
jgi:hypothetical protein